VDQDRPADVDPSGNPWATPASGAWNPTPTGPPPTPEWAPSDYPQAPPLPDSGPRIEWGLGQVWLGLGVAIALNTVVGVLGLGIYLASNWNVLATGDVTGITSKVLSGLTGNPLFLASSLLTLWAGLLLGVFVASYRRGQRNLRLDFGWSIKWRTDIAFGIALAIGLTLVEVLFNATLGWLHVDTSAVDNTSVLIKGHTGAVLIGVFVAAAVGAPMVEELFFRGLTMRALNKRWGAIPAVIGSSLLFGLLHAQPNSAGSIGPSSLWLVLFTGMLGAVLATVALRTQRLGITVVAHMTFNAVGLALVLLHV